MDLKKANSLLTVISYQPDINKMYLFAKDSYETKYWFLINKQESTGLKHFNDSKAFIEYSNHMDNIYNKIKEYNPNKKRKMLIVFVDMIVDMFSNKKRNRIATELFIRGRKLNIFLAFYYTVLFCCAKMY